MTSDPRELAALIQASEAGGIGPRMGTEWLEVSAESVSARIPVEGNTQPFGLLHGGASAVLAESTGSVLANVNAGEGRYAVGIELSCTHHRSAREGFVTATAVPLSVGRTLITCAISVVDDAGRLICSARLTCFVKEA
ncbi:MAG: PaaI family thioesterase [Actinomycetota bacterium]